MAMPEKNTPVGYSDQLLIWQLALCILRVIVAVHSNDRGNCSERIEHGEFADVTGM